MGWARVDDGLDDHPKVLAILDEDDQPAAAAAIALWTLCLTWAHRNTRRRGKTPGLLPASLPRRFLGDLAKDGVQLLVKHRLWDAADDGGWFIHDFDEYLPTEGTRAARAEAGRRGAAKRWNKIGPDGNLPSASHSAGGADPTSEGARAAVEAPTSWDTQNAENHDASPRNATPSSLIHSDGKLPSISHAENGKPIANDGSRAPARRAISKEIAPTPIPVVPPTAGDAARAEPVHDPDDSTAQTIIGEYVDRCRKRPPGQVLAHLGKTIKTLLEEGIDPDDVRRGLAAWMTKGLHPSALPAVVNEAMNTPATNRPAPRTGTGAVTVRHIDQITPEQRAARNPFRNAIRATPPPGASA